VIELHELRRLIAEGDPQIIEVLGPKEFAWAHLPGARNIPLEQIGDAVPAGIDPLRPVVTYCNDFL
jgi:rhodanese-related sulfurtransferase